MFEKIKKLIKKKPATPATPAEIKEKPNKVTKSAKELATEKGVEVKKIYLYYTTCPKCAQKWGKNYVVGFLQIS